MDPGQRRTIRFEDLGRPAPRGALLPPDTGDVCIEVRMDRNSGVNGCEQVRMTFSFHPKCGWVPNPTTMASHLAQLLRSRPDPSRLEPEVLPPDTGAPVLLRFRTPCFATMVATESVQ